MSPISRLKDHWQEQRLTGVRIIACGVMAVLLISLVVAQLINLQFVRYEYYSAQSQGNRIKVKPIAPTRGLIYDRNGNILAQNLPAWLLSITPEQVPDIDSTLAGLVENGLLPGNKLEETRDLVNRRRRFESITIREKLTDEDVARFAVLRPYFPGVEVTAGLARHYPQGATAAHALGYMGAISSDDKERIDSSAYAGTSYIGKTAIERSYEDSLHGTPGQTDTLVNVHGRVIQSLENTLSVPGKDLILTLDLPAQLAAEAALEGRRGAVVAIDPNNGEVLVFASAPSYDPNAFIGGISTADYRLLQDDHDQPLFNRALRGRYPPGSTIKPMLALAAMDAGTTKANHKMFCRGWYSLPGKTHRYRDWKPEGHGLIDMHDAVAQSCDTYFYDLAIELDIDNIERSLKEFGLGSKTGIDIGGEVSGLVPGREWKRNNFRQRDDQTWFPGETVITGIGQGYLLATPLQLAEATAAMAAKGTRFQPQLVKAMQDSVSGEMTILNPVPAAPIEGIADRYWTEAIRQMRGVIKDKDGTGRALGYRAKFSIAGKSGTAQVFSVAQDDEYDEEEIEERMRDHALFIAFAPIEEPKIAVAVVVENGGSGSTIAGPIAKQVMEAYLLKEESSEQVAAR